MPDGLDDLLDDNSNTDSGQSGGKGGGLRAQLEAVLAQNQALTARLAAQEASERQRSLDGLFAKHSIPELAKDFFPKDVDLSDETATGFIEKYGQLWGAQAQVATTTAADQAGATAMQQFASQAGPAPVAPLTEEAYRAKFAEATNKTELLQLISQFEGSPGMGD